MRNLVILIAAAALFAPSLVPPVFGGEKPLPPAFGKELVPGEQTQERNEPKAAQMEEEKDRREHPVAHPGQHGAGGKVHIQLDGGEDGGDGDGGDDDGNAGDDGGEF